MKIQFLFLILFISSILCVVVQSSVFRNDKYHRIRKCQSNEKCNFIFTIVGNGELSSTESPSYQMKVSQISLGESFKKTSQYHYMDEIFSEPESLVVRGNFVKQLSNYHFVANEIYKGLPLNNQQPESSSTRLYFLNTNFLICKTETCAPLEAVNVNDQDDVLEVQELSDPYIQTIDGFDGIWYREALSDHHIMFEILPNSNIKIVRSYAKIDTEHICDSYASEVTQLDSQCTGVNQKAVYKRDEYMCLHSDGCILSKDECDLPTLTCLDGYSLVSIPSRPNGCPINYCDPTFLK